MEDPPPKPKPLTTEKKKPGRKKKPVVPIQIIRKDITLTFD